MNIQIPQKEKTTNLIIFFWRYWGLLRWKYASLLFSASRRGLLWVLPRPEALIMGAPVYWTIHSTCVKLQSLNFITSHKFGEICYVVKIFFFSSSPEFGPSSPSWIVRLRFHHFLEGWRKWEAEVSGRDVHTDSHFHFNTTTHNREGWDVVFNCWEHFLTLAASWRWSLFFNVSGLK